MARSSSPRRRLPHRSCRSCCIACSASTVIFFTLSIILLAFIHKNVKLAAPPGPAPSDDTARADSTLPHRPAGEDITALPPRLTPSGSDAPPSPPPSGAASPFLLPSTPPQTLLRARALAFLQQRQAFSSATTVWIADSSPLPSAGKGPPPQPQRLRRSPPRRRHRTLLPATSLCGSSEQEKLCVAELGLYKQQATRKGRATLEDLTAYVASRALEAVNATFNDGEAMVKAGTKSAVLQDCIELLDGARDELSQVIGRLQGMRRQPRRMKANGAVAFRAAVTDVRAWLSGAYAQQSSCWDEFDEAPAGGADGIVERRLRAAGNRIDPLLSIALSFAQSLQTAGPSAVYALPTSRRRRSWHQHAAAAP